MNDRPTPEHTRRPGVPADPINLADGQSWGFARPTTRLMPVVVVGEDAFGRAEERLTVEMTYGYPLEIQRLLDTLNSALEDGTEELQYEAFFALAAALLLRTHHIDLSSAAALLAVDIADLRRLADEVLVVALGGQPSISIPSPGKADHESAKTNE